QGAWIYGPVRHRGGWRDGRRSARQRQADLRRVARQHLRSTAVEGVDRKSMASDLARWLCALGIASFVAIGRASLPPAAASPGAWKPLFNGHDFTGWFVPPGRGAAPGTPPRNPLDAGWKIEGGAVVGGQAGPGQRGGSLVSQETFKDVELELDFF